MAVTRSKRRNAPREEPERRSKPVVVRRGGSGLSSRERMAVIVFAMSMVMMLVLIGLLECSSSGAKEHIPTPITKSSVMAAETDDEARDYGQEFSDAVNEAIEVLGDAVNETLDEFGSLFSQMTDAQEPTTNGGQS